MLYYEYVGQKCSQCKKSFKTLADEAGTHSCPKCGYFERELEDWEKEGWPSQESFIEFNLEKYLDYNEQYERIDWGCYCMGCKESVCCKGCLEKEGV